MKGDDIVDSFAKTDSELIAHSQFPVSCSPVLPDVSPTHMRRTLPNGGLPLLGAGGYGAGRFLLKL